MHGGLGEHGEMSREMVRHHYLIPGVNLLRSSEKLARRSRK